MEYHVISSLSEIPDKNWFRKAFSELPTRIQKDQNPVALLPPQIWTRFLDLAPAGASEFWVATKGARPVGRIGANLLASYPQTGAIGFFEVDISIPDFLKISHGLVGNAEKWLKEKGVSNALGPMNFNTWLPYRFRTDKGRETFKWEPNNPGDYPKIFTELGFKPCKEYHSIGSSGLANYVAKTEINYVKCSSQGFTFRPFDRTNTLNNEVPILFYLSMAGFKENDLFEPITFEAFRELYVPTTKEYDLSSCFFVMNPQGKEIGFIFCFIDNNYLILKSMAIHQDFRGLGLSNALTYLSGRHALENGISQFVSAMVKVGAQSESYSKKADILWVHRYLLYKKHLKDFFNDTPEFTFESLT